MGMGRAIGEYLHDSFPGGLAYFDQDLSTSIIPATYAVTGTLQFFIIALLHAHTFVMTGAAAFSAGITHTLSTAVIVLEMSGQLNLVAPIMVCMRI
jgi:H+/Cl- antiporter ClcA